MFPLLFCVFFSFLPPTPDFEIISSCYKFSSYFRGGFNRRMVVPFAGFGSGESGQRRDTDKGGACALRAGFTLSVLLCRLPIRWFAAQAVCGL